MCQTCCAVRTFPFLLMSYNCLLSFSREQNLDPSLIVYFEKGKRRQILMSENSVVNNVKSSVRGHPELAERVNE